jgi:hypothetical protein
MMPVDASEEARMLNTMQQDDVGSSSIHKESLKDMIKKRATCVTQRPAGSVFYIMKMEWSPNENIRQTPKVLLNVAPAPWESVRYFLEQKLGMLRACKMGSYLKALLVTDFDTRDLKQFPDLVDPQEIIAPQSVIVVSRAPRPSGLPAFVPNRWVEDFITWRFFDKREQSQKRSRGNSRTESFVSRSHLYLPNGKIVFGSGDWGHASEFVGQNKRELPGGLMCRNCRLMGFHLEADCPKRNMSEEAREIPMQAKKMVRGIPRSSMLLLPEGSQDARYAKLRDELGNCYSMKEIPAVVRAPQVPTLVREKETPTLARANEVATLVSTKENNVRDEKSGVRRAETKKAQKRPSEVQAASFPRKKRALKMASHPGKFAMQFMSQRKKRW